MDSKYVWGISGVIVLCLFSFIMGTLSVTRVETNSLSLLTQENEELKKKIVKLEKLSNEIGKSKDDLVIKNNSTQTMVDSSYLRTLEEKLITGFNYDAYQIYQKIVGDVSSDETSQRDKNLKALVMLDTPEAKEQVIKVIRDKDVEIYLRQDMAREMNWQNYIADALIILNDNDDMMSSSVILAMDKSTLNESERTRFDNALMDIFNEDNSYFLQNLAIDYLANNHPEKLKEINIVSSDKEVQQKLSQHLQELTQNR
jgi:hypothetical protein